MSTIDNEALEWVARQAARELSSEESAAFDAWYKAHPRHQGAYLRARAIEHTLGHVEVQEDMRPLPSARHRRAWMIAGAMAAALGAVTIGAMLPSPVETSLLQTARGEFRKVPLADKSVASINSASQVEVKLSRTERRILLRQGEAWFEVAKDKDKPFIVEAGGVRARALGTAFGVRRYKSGAEVFVTEGVVEVWANDGSARKRLLRAGEQAFVPNAASDIKVGYLPEEVARRLAWRDGKVIFHNEALSRAVAEFNRYNARQIVIADARLRGKTFVGQYRIDQPDQFADDVRTLLGVPVAVTPDKIRIGQ